MQRKDFEQYVNENLEGLSTLDREQTLRLMENEWIPAMIEDDNKCYRCRSSEFELVWLEKTEQVISGSGSDFRGNKYIYVRTDEYHVLNRVCSCCGFGTELKRRPVKKINHYVREVMIK